MNLTSNECTNLFSIMRDLSCDFSHKEVRERIGRNLLELLNADYFASYAWNPIEKKFVAGVQINMCPQNLKNYDSYFQFHDPITHILQKRKKATPVSHIMAHNRLVKTEFFNDFLKKDGLCYGMNYFAYDKGHNNGDIRVWRNSKKNDFGKKEMEILDAIGPCFTNALSRAMQLDSNNHFMSFAQLHGKLGITLREAEIADLVMSGQSDKEICDALNIAKPTLRTHMRAIFTKTDMHRRTQFAPFLLEHQ